MSRRRPTFADKLLPDQPELAVHYTGPDLYRSLYETVCRASGIVAPDEEFVLEQSPEFVLPEMASSPITLRFLQVLIRLGGARRVLEIGAFIGVSAMCLAKALPDDGEVVTIERFDRFAAIARRNFERNGLAGRIRLIEGDALAALPGLRAGPPFDLVFVDGNKERYAEYMRATAELLAPRGLLVVDDVFFHGDAVNAAPTTDKGRGARAALDEAARWDGWLRVVLPVANGILLMVRA